VTACHRFVVLVDDMRVAYFNPNKFDREFDGITKDRLMKAAKVLKASTKRHLAAQIGRGKTTGINRPVYKSGDYAGSTWTAREAGRMMKSVRIVEKKTKTGRVSKKQNTRVYVGHFTAFYADIFEYYRPFLRPAWNESLPMIMTLIGAGQSIGLETTTDRM